MPIFSKGIKNVLILCWVQIEELHRVTPKQLVLNNKYHNKDNMTFKGSALSYFILFFKNYNGKICR